jgi:hypothetical protein
LTKHYPKKLWPPLHCQLPQGRSLIKAELAPDDDEVIDQAVAAALEEQQNKAMVATVMSQNSWYKRKVEDFGWHFSCSGLGDCVGTHFLLSGTHEQASLLLHRQS